MDDATEHWSHLALTRRFVSEGCCFADMDGDGQEELVAGDSWWSTERLDGNRFRDVNLTWLPPWGGGDRVDPHAHLRAGGGPPQYRAATYDWAVPNPEGGPDRLVSVGMHRDPICWFEAEGGATRWRRYVAVSGGIYESVAWGSIDRTGTTGLVAVPDKPRVAWYEPGPEPGRPWVEHAVGERGGGWHGLGLGALDVGGSPHILTPLGFYYSEGDIRSPWRWCDVFQVDEKGKKSRGLGDVGIIHVQDLRMELGESASLFAASPHGRGLWRWDILESSPTRRIYQRSLLSSAVTQQHALAVVPGLPQEGVAAWIISGKRWQAHGPGQDEDPAGTPYLFRVGVHCDPAIPPRTEFLDAASGVGMQIAARRLPGGGIQIATSNKNGVHVFTQGERKSGVRDFGTNG